MDYSSLLASIFGSGQTKSTTTGNTGALQNVLNTANTNASNPYAVLQPVISNAMYQAAMQFAGTAQQQNTSGMYNSSVNSMLSSYAQAQAAAQSAATVANYETSQQQIAASAANGIAQADKSTVSKNQGLLPTGVSQTLEIGGLGYGVYNHGGDVINAASDPVGTFKSTMLGKAIFGEPASSPSGALTSSEMVNQSIPTIGYNETGIGVAGASANTGNDAAALSAYNSGALDKTSADMAEQGVGAQQTASLDALTSGNIPGVTIGGDAGMTSAGTDAAAVSTDTAAMGTAPASSIDIASIAGTGTEASVDTGIASGITGTDAAAGIGSLASGDTGTAALSQFDDAFSGTGLINPGEGGALAPTEDLLGGEGVEAAAEDSALEATGEGVVEEATGGGIADVLSSIAEAAAAASVICTAMLDTGKMPRAWWYYGSMHFNKRYSRLAKQSYWAWATPVAKLMRKKPSHPISRFFAKVFYNRAEYVAASVERHGYAKKRTKGFIAFWGVEILTTIVGIITLQWLKPSNYNSFRRNRDY